MSDPRKVALFVDIENVYIGLRNMYNREIGPELLLEKAKSRGEITKAYGYAAFQELPEGFADKLKAAGFETVQVDRIVHSRELGGKRREVVKDMVPVEMLAGIFKTLVEQPAIDCYVICSGDRALAHAVKIARENFQKEAFVCAIPGSVAKELETVANGVDLIEVPPLEPMDEEGLSKLVPLMEELERRKRYLNFKYIRESVVRHGELKANTFDEAERLLSDAIACGLVLKQKVEDKYHPGQLFTAYTLNRESALWKKYGNGLPAPVRIEGEEEPGELAAAAPGAAPSPAPEGAQAPAPAPAESQGAPIVAPAVPAFASAAAPAPGERSGERGERADDHGRERRGRRGRRGRGDRGEPRDRGGPDDGQESSREGRGDRRGDRRGRPGRGGQPQHQNGGKRDRQQQGGRGRDPGRRPSRWDQPTPALSDDEIDEERILRARGDAEGRPYYE